MNAIMSEQTDLLDQVCESIRLHLDLENRALDQIEAELALPLAGRLTVQREVQERASRLLDLQRHLSEERERLQERLKAVGLVVDDSSFSEVIELLSTVRQSSRLQYEYLRARKRYLGIRQNLLRLQMVVEESNRICQGYLDAMTGQERNRRYGANGRLSVFPSAHLETALPVARAG